MKAHIYVTLKDGVLDPQGKATQNTLHHLGFDTVQSVRQGKFIEVELDAESQEDAAAQLEQMCEQLLANTVIESYRVDLVEAA